MKDILTDTFLNLAETLSFSSTADNLGVSQQAVSNNISRLEKKLGLPLVQRNTRNVSITEWGDSFQQIQKEYDEQVESLIKRFKEFTRTIRVQMLGHVNVRVIEEAVNLYLNDLDDVISLKTQTNTPGGTIESLIQNECDLIITLDRFLPENPKLNIMAILPLNIYLLVSKEYPLFHKDMVWEELRYEPFIVGAPFEKLFDGTQVFVENDIAFLELQPQKMVMKTSLDEVEKAAFNREGIVMASYIAPEYAPENLAAIPTGKVARIMCAWSKDNPKNNLVSIAKAIKAYYASYFSQGFGLSGDNTV